MLQFLLSDNESLAQYLNGSFVSLDDIKRRMLLKRRTQNLYVPDHLYRLEQEDVFDNMETLNDVFTKGLVALASNYLELERNKIYVKAEQQNSLQELLTHLPPLLLQCALLYRNAEPINKKNPDDLKTYFRDFILPNTQYTAIPSSRIPQLDHYLKERNGLHDLHMHLNGALETDQVWQDYLFYPNSIYNDLKKGFRNPKVREQLEQESSLLEPLAYVRSLKIAQKLRQVFFDYIFITEIKAYTDKYALLADLLNEQSNFQGSYKHPFVELIYSGEKHYPYLMSVEGLMYVLILQEISTYRNGVLSSIFHFYLQILGLTNRLLVQQTHQNGFEQFQKHTLNELRESSEKRYLRRYHQMHGNDLRHIRFLEGRFSPKRTKDKMVDFIDTIVEGWTKLRQDVSAIKEIELPEGPELRLIAHFIKKADNKPDLFIRHKALRYEIFQCGKVLGLLLKHHPSYQEKVTGVDAAASEFDAPPEVFASVFRMMRRYGIKHFTYHAGEDFYHILDGLRSIYEAIAFCDLRKGDRIGHATATGISSQLWGETVGQKLHLRKGDHLDNLIFSYHLIVSNKIESLHVALPFIIDEVSNLSFQIYNEHYPISVLVDAWLMRQCCPVHATGVNRDDVILKPIFDEKEWCFLTEKKFVKYRRGMRSNASWRIFQNYHDYRYRKKYDEIISINPFDIMNPEQIQVLQLALLAEMNSREIVIETLPTSNVRIGFHKDFSTYHLYNWIKWREEGKSIPPIIVGSDDTGIFATNIYNEYANIYCALLHHHHMPHSRVMEVIKKLDEDSRIYRFE